jgi:hypothetical protein
MVLPDPEALEGRFAPPVLAGPALSRLMPRTALEESLPRRFAMPAAAAETAPIVPASVYARLRRETNLAAMTQELAGLRFSIILLARWEAARSVDVVNMAELRRELAELRTLYSDTIDSLAMTFGVQQAMETKASVERAVVVPRGMTPPLLRQPEEQLYF